MEGMRKGGKGRERRSILRRDAKFLPLVQPPDRHAAVLRHEAHQLLCDVLELVVALQLVDAGCALLLGLAWGR